MGDHVLSRKRLVAVVTLCLLNLFAVVAASAVATLTPGPDLTPRPPTVAARAIVVPRVPVLGDPDDAAPTPNPATLAARLAGPMRDADLGPAPGAVVIDAAAGSVLYSVRPGIAVVPASTTKLVTSVAALAAVGPGHRLTTKVVQEGRRIVLVGGGDPTLTTSPPAKDTDPHPRPAALTDLAGRTAKALRQAGTTEITLDYDASLYQGSATGPGWKPNYIPDGNAAPVTALLADQGRVSPRSRDRHANPARAAARAFARMLTRKGVTVRLGGSRTAGDGARQIAAVSSPPLSALVEMLLTDSDNDVAEAVARLVAINDGRLASFEGAGQAIRHVLAELGVARGVQITDGSGLSTHNRITPAALASILAVAASSERPELRSVITGMPVAGFTGTLAERYRGSAADGAGIVRAKTGTLDGVSTLAGVAYDSDGRLLAFAFMANDVPETAGAEAALDRLAAAVAGCGCG